MSVIIKLTTFFLLSAIDQSVKGSIADDTEKEISKGQDALMLLYKKFSDMVNHAFETAVENGYPVIWAVACIEEKSQIVNEAAQENIENVSKCDNSTILTEVRGCIQEVFASTIKTFDVVYDSLIKGCFRTVVMQKLSLQSQLDDTVLLPHPPNRKPQ